jgi:molybdopterin converting factor small subunit
MAARVWIPASLRPLTGGRRDLDAQGGSVAEILADLNGRFPGLAANVLADGRLRARVSLYLNGEDIRLLQGPETPIRDGDRLVIVPAIADAR